MVTCENIPFLGFTVQVQLVKIPLKIEKWLSLSIGGFWSCHPLPSQQSTLYTYPCNNELPFSGEVHCLQDLAVLLSNLKSFLSKFTKSPLDLSYDLHLPCDQIDILYSSVQDLSLPFNQLSAFTSKMNPKMCTEHQATTIKQLAKNVLSHSIMMT